MSSVAMTPMQRVLTALGHAEPDRVPLFLAVTLHGARALGLSIRDYFSRAENVVEGQLRMQARWNHDLLYGLFHAAVEAEAFGGEAVYFDDGPPNAGPPTIRNAQAIQSLEPPRVSECPSLTPVLRAVELLKARVGDTIPIVGVVMSPFSLPVMQMGFERYLDLLAGDPAPFWRLMAVNEEFCVEWANAQLRAGATAICYFDPVSSPTVVERELYLRTGHVVARRTLARIQGPTVTHLASGRALPIIDELAATGTAVVGVSALDDLRAVKAACRGRLTVLGNLNGIAMRRWTAGDTEREVKRAIVEAARGGGFILADNHGEIPWQVPESVLDDIAAAVARWGSYPIVE